MLYHSLDTRYRRPKIRQAHLVRTDPSPLMHWCAAARLCACNPVSRQRNARSHSRGARWSAVEYFVNDCFSSRCVPSWSKGQVGEPTTIQRSSIGTHHFKTKRLSQNLYSRTTERLHRYIDNDIKKLYWFIDQNLKSYNGKPKMIARSWNGTSSKTK